MILWQHSVTDYVRPVVWVVLLVCACGCVLMHDAASGGAYTYNAAMGLPRRLRRMCIGCMCVHTACICIVHGCIRMRAGCIHMCAGRICMRLCLQQAYVCVGICVCAQGMYVCVQHIRGQCTYMVMHVYASYSATRMCV